MATQERKVLFSGGKGGYGHALNVGQDGYHWTYGMDCHNGRAVPIAGPSSVGATLAQAVTIKGMFEWPKGKSNHPVLLMPGGVDGEAGNFAYVYELADGAVSLGDSTGVLPYTDSVLYRGDVDATADADEEMAFFCNGDGNTVIRRRKSDGNYSAGTDAKADALYRVGEDLWRVMEDYKLEKLTINVTDPTAESNWGGTRTPVGVPSYPIHRVLEMGGSPVAINGQGVWRYNAAPSVARFENLTPFVPAHPDNGKGAFADGRGRIYYPTVTGRILVVTFGSASQQAPLRHTWIDRDTPWGRIDVMTADEEFIYAALEPGSIRTQELGMVVKSNDGGAYTTHTSSVNDQKFSTTADWSLLGVSDFIYIGADEPFWGVFFEIETLSTGDYGDLVVQYSTGTSSWSSAETHKDSTLRFIQDGCLALLPSTDIVASSTWKVGTVDGQANKYWLRITPGATLTALKVHNVYVCPYRPPLDADVFPETGQMLAGVLPKVLIGQWRGETVVWHDSITLPAAKVENLVVSQVTAADTTGRTTLYIHCGDDIYYLPIGPDADPVRAAWPKTNDVTHAQAFSGLDFGTTASVQELELRGEWLQSNDNFYVYHRWDNGDRWYRHEPATTFPVIIRDLQGEGRVLHVAYQLKDNSRDAIAPYVSWAEIPEDGWKDLGRVQTRSADIASPQEI